jgi:hypothetical protein
MTIQIACEYHGVPHAVVLTTHETIVNTINEVSQMYSKKQCRNIHKSLAKDLAKMLPSIVANGSAISSNGEFYNREIFNQDLVCLAVYDHLGNDKQIALIEQVSH